MSVFLLSFQGLAPRTASERLTGHGIDVLRVWNTPEDDPDFLVVGDVDRDSLQASIESEGLPLRGAIPLIIEGVNQPAHQDVEDHLPDSIPHGIAQLDPVGWMNPPLAWCGTCKRWHTKDKHL
jgi:hypothetical protein